MKKKPKIKEKRKVKKTEYSEEELKEEKLPEQDKDGIEITP